jgi:predicted  nucleic acid-binding Zn-ribbon protein
MNEQKEAIKISQIDELIKPFRKKVDELLAEQNAYLTEYGGLMSLLVEKSDKVAAITQEVLGTLQTVHEGRLTAAEAQQKNHPRAEAARVIISAKELGDLENLIPVFIRRHGEISTKARRLHTVFVTEILPKMNALVGEISGIASCGDGSMSEFKQQLRKIKDNLGYISKE